MYSTLKIKRMIQGLKASKKDYFVQILGLEDMIEFCIYDAETQQQKDTAPAYAYGKDFIAAFPTLFSNPFRAVIVNINMFKNHGCSSIYEFCKVIREKLDHFKIRHHFIFSHQMLHLSIFTAANLSPAIGDKIFVIFVNSDDSCVHSEFELSKNGYKKNRLGRIAITSTPNSPTTINDFVAENYHKIIICNTHSRPIERLKNIFQNSKNLLIITKLEYKNSINKFICEMGKWIIDKSSTKFHVLPWSANKYLVFCGLGDIRFEMIKIEANDDLPAEKSIVIQKTFQHCLVQSIGETGTDVLEKKIFERECHKIEVTLKVDEEHFHSFSTKNIILPEILNLPKNLDQIQKSKIPIIGFWDNSSIICAKKKGGKYKFLQSWNGLFGKELFIIFDKERPSFDNNLMTSEKTKMNIVVYDIIKIMSMPSENIKKDKKWKFSFTQDSDNPVLVEFDSFDGSKKAASPAFLMAILLRQHFKAIRAEIPGAEKRPKEIGFCLLDAWKVEERKRIETQLQEACELLKIQCSFVNL